MNCAECRELLVACLEGLLGESQKQAIVSHLKSCPSCQAEAKQVISLRKRLLKNGKALAQSNLEDVVFARIAQDQNARLKSATRTNRSIPLRRIIMKSPVTKLAAAAVIGIVAVVGIFHIMGGSGVAWAELVEHVEGIKTVAYRMRATMKGLVEMATDQPLNIEMQAKLAYDEGFYINSCTHVENKKIVARTYVLFEEGAIVSVIPQQKKYIKMTLTDDLLAKMQKENGDPRTTLKQMMEHEYTELGFKTINGTKVAGIEVTDPAMGGGMFEEFAAQLWCDVDTDLPVLMTMKGSGKNGEVSMEMTMDNFDWDVEIDTAELEPNIPGDYELLAETQFGMSQDANEFVEVFEFFAKFTDGKYPSSLSGMTVIKEFSDALMTKLSGQSSPSDPNEKEIAMIMKLQTIGMTYAMMVKDGNDPAYYGDRVTAEFPHAVLLRWKVNGNYRVIFGDLTVADVSPDELAELEATPLNTKPKAIKPQPEEGLVATALAEVELSWIPGAFVKEHKVYFGTASDQLSLLAEVSDACSVPAPALERGTTYYWRVDEVQPDGSIATGDVWSFNTGGLVAWWKLDDGSGNVAADSSGNGNNGTLIGDAGWTAGIVGGAVRLDGDGDYVDLGKEAAFDIDNQITVAAWIKVGAFDRQYQPIVTKGDTAWRLQRDNDKNALEFACTGLLVPGTRWGAIHGNVDVNDGQWHHVAGVYDGSKLHLYVDGSLDVSKEASGTIRITDKPVYIGANAEKPERFWNGLIDEVMIYNYGLSADEVAAVHAGR